MEMMKYAVITKVPGENEYGNMASAQAWIDPQAFGDPFDAPCRPLTDLFQDPNLKVMMALYVRLPVFRLGELLVLNDDNRDQFGRKPSKWFIEYETFTDVKRAVARVKEVCEQ